MPSRPLQPHLLSLSWHLLNISFFMSLQIPAPLFAMSLFCSCVHVLCSTCGTPPVSIPCSFSTIFSGYLGKCPVLLSTVPLVTRTHHSLQGILYTCFAHLPLWLNGKSLRNWNEIGLGFLVGKQLVVSLAHSRCSISFIACELCDGCIIEGDKWDCLQICKALS